MKQNLFKIWRLRTIVQVMPFISKWLKLEANSASMSNDDLPVMYMNLHLPQETEKGALAQYVVQRRWVIELLKERRKINKSTEKHEAESIVHEIFCPLGVTSDTLNYDDHNLWLIDDRLAYYSYVTSDKQIRTFTKDTADVTRKYGQTRGSKM